MASIKQNLAPPSLPNFRNLGVQLRILVLANLALAAAAFAKSSGYADGWQTLAADSMLAQPVIIASLLLLAAVNPVFSRLPYAAGAILVLLLELGLTGALYQLTRGPWADATMGPERPLIFAAAVTLLALGYFHLRIRALSPAVSEARLQALQARIRPHFLFNSLNAVLSLIRSDPKRAEAALEDLADLFRALMADHRKLVPLAQEVELCRRYLDLEQLRLGERLQVEWHLESMPEDALIPPLVLQPLIENAVYHGVEPSLEPGVIRIEIRLSGKQIKATLRNPYHGENRHPAGNRMALDNIRERLSLHFDAEASLRTAVHDGGYEVRIVLPYPTREVA